MISHNPQRASPPGKMIPLKILFICKTSAHHNKWTYYSNQFINIPFHRINLLQASDSKIPKICLKISQDAIPRKKYVITSTITPIKIRKQDKYVGFVNFSIYNLTLPTDSFWCFCGNSTIIRIYCGFPSIKP